MALDIHRICYCVKLPIIHANFNISIFFLNHDNVNDHLLLDSSISPSFNIRSNSSDTSLFTTGGIQYGHCCIGLLPSVMILCCAVVVLSGFQQITFGNCLNNWLNLFCSFLVNCSQYLGRSCSHQYSPMASLSLTILT